MAELSEGRGVEGSRPETLDAEVLQPGPHLARGPVGERHRKDRGGLEGPGLDLIGDPARDRGRLP